MEEKTMKPALGAMLYLFSALAMAQAPSGKWTGNAAPNTGDPARCTPNMAFELVVESGKLVGKLDFGTRIQAIEASVAADGKFETSFVNPQGHTVNVTGKLGETLSVVNPIRCGYANIPLKQ
jgi:hypothetical protein